MATASILLHQREPLNLSSCCTTRHSMFGAILQVLFSSWSWLFKHWSICNHRQCTSMAFWADGLRSKTQHSTLTFVKSNWVGNAKRSMIIYLMKCSTRSSFRNGFTQMRRIKRTHCFIPTTIKTLRLLNTLKVTFATQWVSWANQTLAYKHVRTLIVKLSKNIPIISTPKSINF